MQISELQEKIIAFRDERDWKQFHNPKDLAAAAAIETAELEEKFLWKSQTDSYEIGRNDPEVADELADAINFLFLFADACNIDIETAVLNKMIKNRDKYPVEKAKGNSDKYTKL